MTWLVQVGWGFGRIVQCEFIVGHLSCCVAVIVVDCSFFHICDVNYSVLLRISFYIYACVSCNWERLHHWYVFHSITVLFIPLWKLSFWLMYWTNTPFCYAYYFMRKYCVFHTYISTALFAVFSGHQLLTVLRCRVHITAQREGNFSVFQGIQCGVFINLMNRCVWSLIHMLYNTFSVPNNS
jgi:hypothetical protein